MTDKEPPIIEEPPERETIPEDFQDPRFLNNMRNPDFYWTFQLVGRRKVIGRCIASIWDTRGVPITIMIQPPLGKPFEIPWSSIQTIQQGKGD